MRPEYTLAHPSVPPHGVKGGYEAGWEGGMVMAIRTKLVEDGMLLEDI